MIRKYFSEWAGKKNTEKDEEMHALRQAVYDSFLSVVSSHSWNENAIVPIVPAVCGTSLTQAWKIAKFGFSIQPETISGHYGQGLYLTTKALYSLPECEKATQNPKKESDNDSSGSGPAVSGLDAKLNNSSNNSSNNNSNKSDINDSENFIPAIIIAYTIPGNVFSSN